MKLYLACLSIIIGQSVSAFESQKFEAYKRKLERRKAIDDQKFEERMKSESPDEREKHKTELCKKISGYIQINESLNNLMQSFSKDEESVRPTGNAFLQALDRRQRAQSALSFYKQAIAIEDHSLLSEHVNPNILLLLEASYLQLNDFMLCSIFMHQTDGVYASLAQGADPDYGNEFIASGVLYAITQYHPHEEALIALFDNGASIAPLLDPTHSTHIFKLQNQCLRSLLRAAKRQNLLTAVLTLKDQDGNTLEEYARKQADHYRNDPDPVWQRYYGNIYRERLALLQNLDSPETSSATSQRAKPSE